MASSNGSPGIRAAVTAVAHHVPPTVRDNHYFEGRLETNDEWIRTRTGIVERRFAEGEGTSDLLLPAARRCLAQRGVTPEEVDVIIVATITPDRVCPSTAAVLQRKLGAWNAWGYDLAAACSGFVYGLVTAAKLVEGGAARKVLLCGADVMTSIIDPQDRNTAVLFGDGGGAVLVEPSDDPEVGVLDSLCRMNGAGEESLMVPAGGSRMPATPATVAERKHFVVQDGATVFKAAVSGMAEVSLTLMERNGLQADDIAWFVPHQANIRILQSVAKRLGFTDDQVMVNLDRFGNTTGGTIPICLSELHERRAVRYGDTVLLAAFGAGFTMGSVLMRWGIHP